MLFIFFNLLHNIIYLASILQYRCVDVYVARISIDRHLDRSVGVVLCSILQHLVEGHISNVGQSRVQ